MSLVLGTRPLPLLRFHNPCIVDSLGNFPGSTSCLEGREMTDRGGWGSRGCWPRGALVCPTEAEVTLGQGSPPSVTVAVTIPPGNPWTFQDSEGKVWPCPPGPCTPRCPLNGRPQAGCGEGGNRQSPRLVGPAEQKQLGREGPPSPTALLKLPQGWPIKPAPVPNK